MDFGKLVFDPVKEKGFTGAVSSRDRVILVNNRNTERQFSQNLGEIIWQHSKIGLVIIIWRSSTTVKNIDMVD